MFCSLLVRISAFLFKLFLAIFGILRLLTQNIPFQYHLFDYNKLRNSVCRFTKPILRTIFPLLNPNFLKIPDVDVRFEYMNFEQPLASENVPEYQVGQLHLHLSFRCKLFRTIAKCLPANRDLIQLKMHSIVQHSISTACEYILLVSRTK
jgi:hypothetical protein